MVLALFSCPDCIWIWPQLVPVLLRNMVYDEFDEEVADAEAAEHSGMSANSDAEVRPFVHRRAPCEAPVPPSSEAIMLLPRGMEYCLPPIVCQARACGCSRPVPGCPSGDMPSRRQGLGSDIR